MTIPAYIGVLSFFSSNDFMRKRSSSTVGGSKTPNDGLANIELYKEEQERQKRVVCLCY